jgi:hypothetical protein
MGGIMGAVLQSLTCFIIVLIIAYHDQTTKLQTDAVVLIAYQLLFAAFGHRNTQIPSDQSTKKYP